jgi:hypothetical protein
MELVDPTKRETQRNYPAPHVDPAFAEEVSRIFGLNRYGQPNVRLAWGQSRRQWALGDPDALLYVDTRLDPLIRQRHTLRRVTHVELVTVEAGAGPFTGEPAFETREVKHYEVVECEPDPAVIPAGWLYTCEWEYEWIGEQMWYVEQWIPPETVAGGETGWARDRFGPDYHLRTGRFDPFLDITGPFPREGDYESRIVFGEDYLYPVYEEVPVYRFEEREFDGPSGPYRDTVPVEQIGVERVKHVERHKRYVELGREQLELLRSSRFEQQSSSREESRRRRREALQAQQDKRAADDRDYTRRAMRAQLRHAVGGFSGWRAPRAGASSSAIITEV